MKIALIADIHGNFTALDAVLADVDRIGVDQIISLGDVAGSGPQPHEVIEVLRRRHIPSVRGNVDDMLIEPWHEENANEAARQAEEIDLWCREQLTPEDVAYLRSAPATLEITLGRNDSLLAFHGTPRSNREIIRATTPDAELAEALGPTRTVMAGGHTHEAMIRRFGDTLVVNPGSVGLPVEFSSPPRNPAWAEYAMLDRTDGALGIELKRIPVDVERVRRAAFQSGMPYADTWAADWR